MTSKDSQKSDAEDKALNFFVIQYQNLRGDPPMHWMKRMFKEVITGQYPRLVDLPTGAGKTQLAVIWLLALAWYGKNRDECQPVPRRLVWVVNRRVLVQQVFAIAAELKEKLTADGSPALEPAREGLRALSGGSAKFFDVVELRGQIVADREWAIRPTVPQLIIGTVDQIGSRLLFQGYGLGKWGRPQQAGLLGVDSWIAVDEAHLVPAFVLTLRQLHGRCSEATNGLPPPLDAMFARLPFWLTELSATPGLPRPSAAPPFSLSDDEKTGTGIEDRILAADTRSVVIAGLPTGEKPKEILIQQLVEAAFGSKAARIAVFVREVGVADKVADGIKKRGIAPERICKITGRLRGYERDRLAERPAFRAFLTERVEPSPEDPPERFFLIGTAAAEVGLDADADEILCDFAPLPTLLQRLGRLDRRGGLSRRHEDGKGDAPTMRVFATHEEIKQKIKGQLCKVVRALNDESAPYSAKMMAGTHWIVENVKKEESDEKAEDEKGAANHTESLIEAATWRVLRPKSGTCTQPSKWLKRPLARVAAGPVTVPPLTDTVLDYWSATTEERSPQLSPHPYLYGLGENDEGTPLVGVAFRLELEALREVTSDDEEDTESPDVTAEVAEIFKSFPPLRAELHQIPLSAVRVWLATPEAEAQPLIYRDVEWLRGKSRTVWRAKLPGESTAAAIRALGPNGVMILSTSIDVKSRATKAFLKDCQQDEAKNTAISDVLDGVSKSARYRRTIEPATGRTGTDGAWLWNTDPKIADAVIPAANLDAFNTERPLLRRLRIGGTEYAFRYFRPKPLQDKDLQYLDNHGGTPGHLTRAAADAHRLADAITPSNDFLRTLLTTAARLHDEGKRFSKWQRAFGRPKGDPEIAKLHPDLERPAPLNGFRHEWESLRVLVCKGATPPPEVTEDTHGLWHDLLLHLVGSHHGHLRPSIADDGLTPNMQPEKHNPLRLEAAERFARLQRQLGRWRLAYLEALLKTADAEGSRILSENQNDMEDEEDGI